MKFMFFIYSADLTFQVIRKKILSGLNPHATKLINLMPVLVNIKELFRT